MRRKRRKFSRGRAGFTEEYGIALCSVRLVYQSGILFRAAHLGAGNLKRQRETTSLGGNTAPKTKKVYQQLLESSKELCHNAVHQWHIYPKGNATELSGVYEGRLAYARLERKKTVDGRIKYLMISYQLRPELQRRTKGLSIRWRSPSSCNSCRSGGVY